MKSTSGWKKSGSGSNSSGFNGLPGGIRGRVDYDRTFRDWKFDYFLTDGNWWYSSSFGFKGYASKYDSETRHRDHFIKFFQ